MLLMRIICNRSFNVHDYTVILYSMMAQMVNKHDSYAQVIVYTDDLFEPIQIPKEPIFNRVVSDDFYINHIDRLIL